MLMACVNLDDVCRVLNRGSIIQGDKARELLTNLKSWSSALPSELRHFSPMDDSALACGGNRTTIGNVHISSVYYFAVILVTRPFLIRTLMPSVRRRSQAGTKTTIDPADSALAQVCISSAVYMGQLCGELASMLQTRSLPLHSLSLLKYVSFTDPSLLTFDEPTTPICMLDWMLGLISLVVLASLLT